MVVLSLGCSKKPVVVGTWENTSVRELIEFKADNSGVIQGKNLEPLGFTWKETAKDSYNLSVNFQGQQKILKGFVQNDTLILENEAGKETYRKRPID